MAVRKQPAKPAAPQNPKPAGDLTRLIAEAAYYRAEQRGFAPGHELDDWIAAEDEVRRTLQR